jgi:uncharacterized membrane protein
MIILGIIIIIIQTLWNFKLPTYHQICEMKMFSEWDVKIRKGFDFKFVESGIMHDIARIHNITMIVYPSPFHWGFNIKGQEMDYSTWEMKQITKHQQLKKPPF